MHVYVSENVIKMESSLLVKFGQRPCIVQGIWPDFGANLKNFFKSNFDQNQLKLSTQHKYMYMYQKNYKNGEFSRSHFW